MKDIINGFIGGLLSILFVFVCLGYLGYQQYDDFLKKLEIRPPIMVVNTMALLAPGSIGSSEEELIKKRERIYDVVDKFKNAGYLVIDANSVLTSPELNTLTQKDIVE